MILVTGASGYVGGAVLKRLSERGHSVSAMVRNLGGAAEVRAAGVPIRIANYDDRSSLERAFEGVDRLVFVASDGDARAVMRQHANVIDAAADAGIGHIVFTSIVDMDAASTFYFTPVYRDAEGRLAERGAGATILRCGLYADLILSNWLRPARETGEIALPLAEARVAPISRDDVAEALANVAASETPGGGLYHLTGPTACSFDEIAVAASTVFRVTVRYVPCAPADYLARLWAEASDPWPHAFSSLCRSISEGRYGTVSPDFERLVGRPAEDFESFLRRAVTGRPR
ncbi:SDR family oxidoreductase [Sinorhizobium mexicanum]|uniref:SDR family oxidoreductase n=1 Tax=Sinorhizobium mexicanum TaxID=375549 RepID=A0A859QCS1_9HYPH|nr:SDR family oxidoreductase [Sinorhizobium mexicanum]MBP1883220.1 NAD(P)H dehydrogenase (quinone) [Sinorhizobium mexicanum]QLL62433.1 SDR family oxidoreductase [Sinorhizobium mexicanum]